MALLVCSWQNIRKKFWSMARPSSYTSGTKKIDCLHIEEAITGWIPPSGKENVFTTVMVNDDDDQTDTEVIA